MTDTIAVKKISMQDSYFIDKARVRASFNRAASTYDAAAVLQKLVREEMLSRLDYMKIAPESILDAGCGTGHASIGLQRRFKKASVYSLDIALLMLQKAELEKQNALQSPMQKLLHLFSPQKTSAKLICADIENLPIADNSFGMVWSSLALQWCNDLDIAFAEVSRVLQPESLFFFSTFGPDTLNELRTASREVNSNNTHTHVSRFIDMHDIGDALIRSGFSTPVLDVERYTLTYDDVKGVMRDLKSIGANNATEGRARNLQGKGFLQRLTQQYEQFRVNGKLPATFEVVYGHAWKPIPKPHFEDSVSPITFKKRI
jgi:malonyl-CoA O-methyltransferase